MRPPALCLLRNRPLSGLQRLAAYGALSWRRTGQCQSAGRQQFRVPSAAHCRLQPKQGRPGVDWVLVRMGWFSEAAADERGALLCQIWLLRRQTPRGQLQLRGSHGCHGRR